MGIEAHLELFSSYDPEGGRLVKNASPASIPTETTSIFSRFAKSAEPVRVVYGLEEGKVYEEAKEWLQEAPHHQLIILEDDPGVLRRYFEKEEAGALLQDPRALLLFFDHLQMIRKVIKSCLHVSLDRQAIYILPSFRYEKEKKEAYEKLRRHLYLMVDKSWGETEFIWGSPLIPMNHLKNLEKRGEAYYGLNFPQRFKGTPAIICGAGASLSTVLDQLSSYQNKALIIAGGSAVNILSSYSILPHLVVGLDPTFVQVSKLAQQTAFEVPFVYADRLHHEGLNWVHGSKLYISREETSPPSEPLHWFDTQLGCHHFLKEIGYSVSNVAIAYAHYLGCNPLILVGMDLAYTKNVPYAPGMNDHPLLKSHPSYVPLQHQLYSVSEDPEAPKITLQFAKEREWIRKFAEEHPETDFFNASVGGMEIPQVPFSALHAILDPLSLPSRDLRGELHAASITHPFPASTREKIRELRRLWRASCERADHQAKKAIEALEALLEGKTPASLYLSTLQLCDLQLKEEPVYHHYLEVFEEAYEEVLEANTLYWALRPHIDEKEIRRFKDNRSRWKFLRYRLEVFLNADKEVPHQEKSLSFPVGPYKPLYTSNLVEGKKEGVARLFYPEGTLYSEENYKNNLLDGPLNAYYPDGTLKSALFYKQGKLEGKQQLFYTNGELKRELHFAEGKREGLEKLWSPSQKLLMELSYHGDTPVGIGRWWDEKGNLKGEKDFNE